MARTRIYLAVLAVLAGALAASGPAAAGPLRADPATSSRPVGRSAAAPSVPAPRARLRKGSFDRDHAVVIRGRRGSPAVLPRGARLRARASIDGYHGAYATKLNVILTAIDSHYARTLGSAYRRPALYPGAERFSSFCGHRVDNAMACVQNGYHVAWNTRYLRSYYDHGAGGDMAVAALLAHEYGHLSQWQLNLGGAKTRISLYRELYADCMSGTFAAAMYLAGRLDAVGVGDYQEARNMMWWLGSPDAPNRSHGTGAERQAYFAYGWSNGAQACVNWLQS